MAIQLGLLDGQPGQNGGVTMSDDGKRISWSERIIRLIVAAASTLVAWAVASVTVDGDPHNNWPWLAVALLVWLVLTVILERILAKFIG
jgi:hypothetical protein